MNYQEYKRQEDEARAKALWQDYIANHNIPDDIPPNPDEVYADEWRGWVDWIGGLDDGGDNWLTRGLN